jgi:hypothetical protein
MSSLTDRSLREKNEDRIDQLFVLFERLRERPDLQEDMEEVKQALEDMRGEIETLQENSINHSKAHKVDRIVEAGRNKADPGMKGVVMDYRDIMAATGVSNTQAYRYIEQLPKEYDYLADRADLPEHIEADALAKDRGLVIDLTHAGTK